MKPITNLTDAELETLIVQAESMTKAGIHSPGWREYDRSSGERANGHTKLLQASREAARRGILPAIRARHPGLSIPQYAKLQEIHQLLETQRAWVANRGFVHDKNLVEALEQFLAFHRVLRRPELTGEDVAREIAAAFSTGLECETHPSAIFEAGLRRGFEMRAEEIHTTTPPTNPEGTTK